MSCSSQPGTLGQLAKEAPDQEAPAEGDLRFPGGNGVREDVQPPDEALADINLPSSKAPSTEGAGVSPQLDAADEQPQPLLGLARPVGPMPTLWQATRLVLIIFAALAVIGVLAQSVHPGH